MPEPPDPPLTRVSLPCTMTRSMASDEESSPYALN
jgi:hypothetical protein